MKKVIAYYRVSTNDQNLGIEAQKSIVKQYCIHNSAEIISEYEEHESGKNNNRVKLAIALAETVKTGSYLIVAKIDRLTRVAYYGLQLCEKYRIIFCDHPTMGTLEQSIYFGMAQQEREYISQRTKAALKALKSNKESRILYPIQIGIIASVLRPDEPNLPIQIDNQLRNYR